MVRRLLWLKWALLRNGLRKDWQRRIGLPASIGLIGWASVAMAGAYLDAMNVLGEQARIELGLWAALLLFMGWVSLPVVIFPLDENLDPDQFSLMPITGPRLVLALAASSIIAPSFVIPLVTNAANLVAFRQVWPAAAVAAVLMAALMLVSGQLFTTVVSAILRTRRGRDLAMVIVAGIGLVGFGAQELIRRTVAENGLEAALLEYPITGLLAALPPVAVQKVVTSAVAGNVWAILGWAVVAIGWILVLGSLWRRLLDWMLTTPQHTPARSRERSRAGFAGGRWWTERTVMARKELRFYVRDPRQRLVWTGAVIFLGLGAASILLGSGSLNLFSDREWLPLMAPVLVLFVGLPIALNMFGWERNAASFLFVLPVKPRSMMLGKNLAVGMGLIVETSLMALIISGVSGSWAILRFLPALMLCAVLCQLSVGNLTSVLTPLRLPREGTDVFAQATEQGCLAIVSQLVSFFAIGLLLVLPSSVMVLTVDFGRVLPEWFAHVFAVIWGAIFYSISLWLAGALLKRRVPEVVSWVQVV